MRVALANVAPLLLLPRCSPPRMDITVCTGGACAESGAELLLDACTVLAAGDTSIEVKSAFCSGECPAEFAMLCPKRGQLESYQASCGTLDEALAAAEEAITAAESSVEPGLREAFLACAEAKEAEAGGDHQGALDKYAAALKLAPAALNEPCQPPLDAEVAAWAGSRWSESLFSSVLIFESVEGAESLANNAEFGTCGGGTVLVDKKVVTTPKLSLLGCALSDEHDGRGLSGLWEDSAGGAGAFELTMMPSGRSFTGTLTAAGGEARPWSGLRKAAPPAAGNGKPAPRGPRRRGPRGEAPPSRVKWLHDARLARARCHLELGDAVAAVDEARAATQLCCRAPVGHAALAEMLEASGDAQAAEEARAEVAYLKAAA